LGRGAPYKTKDSHNRKAENNSNAVLLLFFALRQPARSTSAQQKPVALLFVHPAFVVLLKAFDLIQNKREATNAKRKTRVILTCCCFPLCVK
jgi:hypothetical protein